jgi:hypothetical protein
MRVARLAARRSTPSSDRRERDPRVVGRGREKFIVQRRRFAAKGSPLPHVREDAVPPGKKSPSLSQRVLGVSAISLRCRTSAGDPRPPARPPPSLRRVWFTSRPAL